MNHFAAAVLVAALVEPTGAVGASASAAVAQPRCAPAALSQRFASADAAAVVVPVGRTAGAMSARVVSVLKGSPPSRLVIDATWTGRAGVLLRRTGRTFVPIACGAVVDPEDLRAIALPPVPLPRSDDPAPAESGGCPSPQLRTRLDDADTAFVGRAVDVATSGAQKTMDGSRTFRVRFAVTTAVKGSPRTPVEVVVRSRVAPPTGQPIGVLIRNATLFSCEPIVTPDALLAAARPLPPPTGAPPVAALVLGRVGAVRVVGINAAGETVVRAERDHAIAAVAPCPGGRRYVEVTEGAGRLGFETADLTTLRPVTPPRAVAVPPTDPAWAGRALPTGAAGDFGSNPRATAWPKTGVVCRDPDGGDVAALLLGPTSATATQAMVVGIRPDATAWSRDLGGVRQAVLAPDGRVAVVLSADRGQVRTVDIESGTSTAVVDLASRGLFGTWVSLDPSGRTVLVAAAAEPDPPGTSRPVTAARVIRVPLDDPSGAAVADLPAPTVVPITWLADGDPVVALSASWGNWTYHRVTVADGLQPSVLLQATGVITVVGNRAYVADGPQVTIVELASGRVQRIVAELDGPLRVEPLRSG